MKKNAKYIRILLVLFFAYILLSSIGGLRFVQSEDSFSEWILGKWEGARVDDTRNTIEKIHLEFLRSGIMVYSSSLSPELQFGIVYRYTFSSQNQLDMEGRIRDMWKLERKGDRLLIESGIWRSQEVTFRRILRLGPISVTLLGILIVELLLFRLPLINKHAKNEVEVDNSGRKNFLLKVPVAVILHFLMLAIGYKSFDILIRNFSDSQLLLYQGLPWWALILIEIFVITFLLGIRLINLYRNLHSQNSFFWKGVYYSGIFLIGGSLYGLFIGLIRLTFLYIIPAMLANVN